MDRQSVYLEFEGDRRYIGTVREIGRGDRDHQLATLMKDAIATASDFEDQWNWRIRLIVKS
jgi:hypothetical protein